MESWHELQLHALLQAADEMEAFATLSRAARELEFDYCAYGMRVPLPAAQPRLILLNNYPADWQERYARQNYIAIDPTVAHGMRSVAPLLWSQTFGQQRDFWEDARAHGLHAGWAQSCFDGRGVGGMLTLARSKGDVSARELRQNEPRMSWLAHAAHETMSRLLVPKLMPDPVPALSDREIEVLRWTADGKTASEVGSIMNIAEATVNFHINKALAKLRVKNKVAAAVKTVFLGLL